MNNDVHSQKFSELQDLHRMSFESLLQDSRLSIFYSHKSLDCLPKEQKGGDRHRFRRTRVFGRYFWTTCNRWGDSLKLQCHMPPLSAEAPVTIPGQPDLEALAHSHRLFLLIGLRDFEREHSV